MNAGFRGTILITFLPSL